MFRYLHIGSIGFLITLALPEGDFWVVYIERKTPDKCGSLAEKGNGN